MVEPRKAMEELSRARSTCGPERFVSAAVSLYEALSVDEGQSRLAESWIADSMQKRPELVAFTTPVAALWLQHGRLGEAESLLRRIIAVAPGDVSTLNNLAWLLAMRNPPKVDDASRLD